MAADYTNYVSYEDPETRSPRIGHLYLQDGTIQVLTFQSGASIDNLYQVIEAGEENICFHRHEEPIPLSSVKILPPITGRDILAVGKNYYDHAKEFNRSGFDSSDKVDIPSRPVIFTKRATSVIAHRDNIYHHPEFTQSLDYEGEIGVIVGKAGYRIKEEDAMCHVWGYTIINDVTARERQRDHKQFFIGKSGDTFCPMGPIAKPAKHLPDVLRLQTIVNDKPEQDATSKDLIFSIPFLIKTLSEGMTLQPGDIIATGTPAGVGIGKTPPVYLQPGDTISISVTGLGTLTNTVTASLPLNNSAALVHPPSALPPLTMHLLRATITPNNTRVLFIPAPGSSVSPFSALIAALHPSGKSFAFDLPYTSDAAPFASAKLSALASPLHKLTQSETNTIFPRAASSSEGGGLTLIAHGLGAFIALQLAASDSQAAASITKLILINPALYPLPFSPAARRRLAALARSGRAGSGELGDFVERSQVGSRTRRDNPLAVAACRMAAEAQAQAGTWEWVRVDAEEGLDLGSVRAEVLVVGGAEDEAAPPEKLRGWVEKELTGAKRKEAVVLEGVGRWAVLEDVEGVKEAVGRFLGGEV